MSLFVGAHAGLPFADPAIMQMDSGVRGLAFSICLVVMAAGCSATSMPAAPASTTERVQADFVVEAEPEVADIDQVQQVDEPDEVSAAPTQSADETSLSSAVDGLNPLTLLDYMIRFEPVEVVEERCGEPHAPGEGELFSVDSCALLMLEPTEAFTPSPDSGQWLEVVSIRFDRAYSTQPFTYFVKEAIWTCDESSPPGWFDHAAFGHSGHAELLSMLEYDECSLLTEADRAAVEDLDLTRWDTVDPAFCAFLLEGFNSQPGLDASATFDEVVAHIDLAVAAMDRLELAPAEARELAEMRANELSVRAYVLESEAPLERLVELSNNGELALISGSLATHDVGQRLSAVYTPVCVEAREGGRVVLTDD